MLETHPYNSIPMPLDTTTLVVGTAPPPRFSLPRPPHEGPKKGWDADLFYGSKDNCFWDYLKEAAGEPLFAEPGKPEAACEDTENLMQDYLQRHRLWMKDVLQTYLRKEGHEKSAQDRYIDLTKSTFTNFSSVLASHQKIKKIVFTSTTTANWFFNKALMLQADSDEAENYGKMFSSADNARKQRNGIDKYTKEFCEAMFGGRNIKFYLLPSPSNSVRGFDRKKYVEICRKILFDQV